MMTNNGVKIYAFTENKFIEVEETYFCNNSDDITFIHNDQVFKITNVDGTSKKRKRDELENENIRLTEENIALRNTSSQIKKLSSGIISKSKKILHENARLKQELLETHMKIEKLGKEIYSYDYKIQEFADKLMEARMQIEKNY